VTYRFHDISFAYSRGVPVLGRVSLDIPRGDFAAIVGPNGAGKSTLLKLAVGLLDGFTGTAELLGRPIALWPGPELARKVAMVPQETHVVFPFTVEEMVLMGRSPYTAGAFFDPPREAEVADRAMELTDTRHLAGKTFNELSGGERQRVVLASALAQSPEVLLLDEPTVYLDIKHQLGFYRILERLNSEEGMTIVAVTHDINLAGRYARRMIALRDGTLLADGVPTDVLTPRKLYEIFEVNVDVIGGPGGGTFVIPTS
jgi:iron complex transport system ATP-binding protein